MLRLLLTVCSFLFFKIVSAQDDSIFIRKLADEILTHSKAYSNLHELTKSIGPRLSGSAQTYKAEEWAKKENLSLLAARQQKYITNLENALVRIKNGTYGICSVTGKLISKERLIAVPHTTQSIEAKMMQQD